MKEERKDFKCIQLSQGAGLGVMLKQGVIWIDPPVHKTPRDRQ